MGVVYRVVTVICLALTSEAARGVSVPETFDSSNAGEERSPRTWVRQRATRSVHPNEPIGLGALRHAVAPVES